MNKANECTCPSGDGSLRWPCPKHPAVEQAGGDERAAFEAYRDRRNALLESEGHKPGSKWHVTNAHYPTWEASRAALAQPSPAQADEKPGDSILCYGCFAKGVGPDHFDEAGKCLAAQAEAERPEVEEVSEFEREDIARSAFETAMADGISLDSFLSLSNTLAARYDRIVGALRAENAKLSEALDECDGDRWKLRSERDAANARLHEVATACATAEQQRDAALARVAELERQVPVATVAKVPGEDWNSLDFHRDLQHMQPGTKLYAAPVARAQHSVPEGWMLVECGIWTQEQVDEMQKTVTRFRNSEFVDDRALAMAVADAGQCKAPEISLAELLAAAPGNSVPQAWLDVQAERRRQITAEGWTPEHDDEHADGQMAQAAGCYALHAGGIGTDWPDGRQNGAALFWPWDKDSWKPTTPRRDLVKACALALAEIERLDRAGISQSPQPGATTASS
ncbi:TPA: hypothetical protein ACKPF5_001204 [Pseudomonas aeruginosa]|uniref:hypothetical protein n=1 Tax=Pseudomonas aeruginosa TaxID=287 RepID=UPI000A453AE1|nr:hypothetical protein [Pseudomonas aeruginosa]